MDRVKSSYKNYENVANNTQCDTLMAGRYSVQKEDERRIVPDLFIKLNIKSSDNLLEIGCGTGNLLIPLSFSVDKVVGLDNNSAIQKLLNRTNASNLKGVAGNFLTYDINSLGKFKKILIYSVLHCLVDKETVYSFIDRALSLLEQDGVLLLGDIPNISLKNNFLKSNTGKKFSNQWQKRMEGDKVTKYFESSFNSYIFDDKNIFNIMQHIKAKGYKVYLLPQPSDLPFGHTREDIVVSFF
jgi:cyclopropane fatty-acyl-phospholipid synthase-like methyltransferase